MSKIKNITISLLLIIVISIGFSASICASTKGGSIRCNDAYCNFVPDSIPYLELYASYSGYYLDSPFRTWVSLNYDNTGSVYYYGIISWTNSTAHHIKKPAYGSDPYTWDHGAEFMDY